jgi:hypothetical protein
MTPNSGLAHPLVLSATRPGRERFDLRAANSAFSVPLDPDPQRRRWHLVLRSIPEQLSIDPREARSPAGLQSIDRSSLDEGRSSSLRSRLWQTPRASLRVGRPGESARWCVRRLPLDSRYGEPVVGPSNASFWEGGISCFSARHVCAMSDVRPP